MNLTSSKTSVLLFLIGLVLCTLLPLAENLHVEQDTDKGDVNLFERGILPNDSIISNVEDDVVKAANIEFRNLLNESRSKFLSALKNLSSYLPIDVEYTVTVGKRCNIIKYNRKFYEAIPLILSAVMIIVGVIFGYFGYRLIKIVLFLIGFLFGFAITYFIIAGFTEGRPEHWIPYVALASAALAGIFLGLLTICIYYIGIFLAGGSIGFLIVWFILASINISFFRDRIYIPILIAVAVAIITGIVALLIQKWFFMFGMAILGAFLVVWGLDYYIELGSMIYFILLYAEHRSSLKPCWYSWMILPLFVILFVSGLLIQAFVTGRKYNHKKEMKGICCGLCSRKSKDTRDSPSGGPKYMKLKPIKDDK